MPPLPVRRALMRTKGVGEMVRRNLIRALGLDASEKDIKIAEWMESNGGEWIEWMVELAQRKTDDKTFWRYVAALKLVKKSLGAAEERLREIIEEVEREQDSWWSADHDAPYPPRGWSRTLEELEAEFNWHIARRLEGVVSDISAEAVGDDGKMAEDFPTYIAWLRLLGHLFLGAARDRIKAICEEEERRAFAMGVHAHLTDKEIEYGEMDCRWQTAVAMRDRRLARDCVNAMRKECERTENNEND